MNREELAWAAGFFDGEGNVRVSTWEKNFKNYYGLKVSISQNDREVLDRFQVAVGVGNVTVKMDRGKKCYQYTSSSFQDSQHVMCLLWNFLSSIKQEQFYEKAADYRVYTRRFRSQTHE